MKPKSPTTKVYVLLTQSDASLDVRLVYLDDKTDKPRNFLTDSFSGMTKTDLYYDGLGLHASWYQGTRDKGEWLCHEMGYYESYRITQGMAAAMLQTLRLLDKRITDTTNTLGYPTDFADNVVRFGAAVGVAGYLVLRGRNSSSYDENEYHCIGAQGILSHIRAIADARQTVSVG